MEEITKEQFDELSRGVTPITSLAALSMEDIDIQDCEGGACPVR
jgi:hypothetical protein